MEKVMFYEERASVAQRELDALRRMITYMSIVRLLSFLSIILFVTLCFGGGATTLEVVMTLTSIVVFGVAVKLDLGYEERCRYLVRKRDINRAEISALNGEFSAFRSGEEYMDLNRHLFADFDIVGRGSLFQYINRSATRGGERRFIEGLADQELCRERIIRRQEAIRELTGRCDFMQDFQIYGSINDEGEMDMEYLRRWVEYENRDRGLIGVLAWVVPTISVLWVALYICGVVTLESASLPFIINLVISFSFNRQIVREHSTLNRASKIISKYSKLLSLIEDEKFKSDILVSAQQRLCGGGVRASVATSKLSKLLGMFDSRYNIFAVIILNALFGYNLHLFMRLMAWRQSHLGALSGWFESIVEVDSMLGLATYAFNGEGHYPTIEEGEFCIRAVDVGHPLIPSQRRVCNTIEISKSPSVVIITGANMAGKSTFLRTIATNMILAMSGAPVTASEFRFTPCAIMSSIKIQDSLYDNESYFYAEISRLRDIAKYVDSHPRTLVILDEILRGTNTKDKQSGSLGLLKRLTSHRAIIFIATHDLMIGELERESPDVARNYCFEVELDGGALSFDYRLKSGVSQKLNASYLLREMGLIE